MRGKKCQYSLKRYLLLVKFLLHSPPPPLSVMSDGKMLNNKDPELIQKQPGVIMSVLRFASSPSRSVFLRRLKIVVMTTKLMNFHLLKK